MVDKNDKFNVERVNTLEEYISFINKGNIIGEKSICHLDSCKTEIIEKYSKYLENANHILLNFKINPDVSLSYINEIIEYLDNNIENSIECDYQIQSDSSFSENQIEYTIVITGL